MYRLSRIMTLLVIIILPFFLGCEGPQGPGGSQGPQGPEGPVGPAGEDGSVMYSGQGGPSADIGQNGDYYLNQNTGELYGPKDSDGWGNPIIVLMGKDGEDGKDGQDGQDGEDGSQIHSGSGAPDATLGVIGDYYLDKSSYELYGPKTNNGWGTPINLKGAEGNANVTRYIFPSHDFSVEHEMTVEINLSQEAFNESAWLAYVVNENGWKYQVPGPAYGSTYTFYYAYRDGDGNGLFVIGRSEGTGEVYNPIEIVRIEASETVDNRKQKGDSIIPDDLDTSDYEAVAEHYNIYSE